MVFYGMKTLISCSARIQVKHVVEIYVAFNAQYMRVAANENPGNIFF